MLSLPSDSFEVRVFSHRPAVFRAWQQLNGSIKEAMDARGYELATLAAARHLRSSYCALAHGKVLADGFLAPETVRDVVVHRRSTDLDPADIALIELADKWPAMPPRSASRTSTGCTTSVSRTPTSSTSSRQ